MTFLIEVAQRLSGSASSRQADAPKDGDQRRSLTGEPTWSGRQSFGCGCVQRQLSPKAFAAVNAEHIYALFFHQERYPATHLPVLLGLLT